MNGLETRIVDWALAFQAALDAGERGEMECERLIRDCRVLRLERKRKVDDLAHRLEALSLLRDP